MFPPVHVERFAFRFEAIEGGGVRIWLDVGTGESGPITLTDSEGDQVGELLARMFDVLNSARDRERGNVESTASTEAPVAHASAQAVFDRPTSRAPTVQLPAARKRGPN